MNDRSFMQSMDSWLMFEKYKDQINNDTAKVAFLQSKEQLMIIKGLSGIIGTILKERWLNRPSGFIFAKNHILFWLAEDILQQTIATGIPQRRKEFYDEIIYQIEPEIEDDEPKVLTLNDLAFGFNIVLIALGVSCIVFILEIIHFQLKIKMRRYVRSFLGKLFVLMNVLQWLRRYHA
jgi:hypothetical protein